MMRRWRSILLALAGIVLAGAGAAADDGITSEQAKAILDELRQMRVLLEQMARQGQTAARPAPPANPRVTVRLGEHHSLGSKDAPVTLVEFTDYQCPFCKRFHDTALKELKTNYVDTGKVRFVTRDLPLEIHREALKAAQAARCAGAQGKFWEMRERLLGNTRDLSADSIKRHAGDLSLDPAAFEACVASDRFIAEIQRDVADAGSLGITGTPTFVLGKTTKDGVEGVKLVGAQPYSAFAGQIDSLLAARP